MRYTSRQSLHNSEKNVLVQLWFLVATKFLNSTYTLQTFCYNITFYSDHLHSEICKAAVEEASQQAEKFEADCKELLMWISEAANNLQESEPLSSDLDILREQMRQNRVSGVLEKE